MNRTRSRYVIGIDLGTTNSAVSYIDTRKHPFGGFDAIRLFSIPQVVSEGRTASREGLPSFLYLEAGHEFPSGSLDLPWAADPGWVVGEFARWQGARVPGRLIASAKSWLCHPGVDRKAPILPWGDVGDVKKRSPVDAAAAYLNHIRTAWDHHFGRNDPSQAMAHQEVALTVPASFDEIARELTLEAAQKAGLPNVTLLEEPQAAFYAWLARHESAWEQTLEPGKTILVCDIGGGTTDFALIRIKETETGPAPERIAVGEHLLLGGDNMDMTLARLAEQRMLGADAKRLDSLRWHMLTARCRDAKELLLRAEQDRVSLSVPGRGKGVVAGSLSAELTREDVLTSILDGFFPFTGGEELPSRTSGLGIQEWGLPFVNDPVIPHHLAAFLKTHLQSGSAASSKPDAVFFNGGVFASKVLADRMLEILSGWFSSRPDLLENHAPDLAVCQGAAYYGMVRRGRGVRIVGGSPRSYYVGVAAEGEQPAGGEIQAVCVVARGMEAGEAVEIDSPVFTVLANQPVAFSLYSSNERAQDAIGEVLTLEQDAIEPLPPLRTVLQYGKKGIVRKIPVSLDARLTEVGTLDLSCRARKTDHRWRLRFDIRPAESGTAPSLEAQPPSEEALSDAVLAQALQTIGEAFETKAPVGKADGVTPGTLIKTLRRITGRAKEDWPMPVLRRFAETLLEQPEYRTPTARHEERWLNLMGFCLRPGYGYGGDEFRTRKLNKIYDQGLLHERDAQCLVEWWVLWRRIAGGLNRQQQLSVFRDMEPLILPGGKKKKKARRVTPRERTEMWRTVANLERLPVDIKTHIGRHLLGQLGTAKGEGVNLWVCSRLGARIPLYGPLETVIPGKTITGWLKRLLSVEWQKPEHTGPCAVQMACFTGDRERDVDEAVRDRLRDRLEALHPDERLIRRLYEVVVLSDSEQNWIFGEDLPGGLHLAK